MITIIGTGATIEVTGDINQTITLDTADESLILGDGTVLTIEIDEDEVMRFAVDHPGRVDVLIEEADPDGPTPQTDTVTVDGFVPWIGLASDGAVFDGMAPPENALAAARAASREIVLAVHNAAMEARGETEAGPGEHAGPARECVAEMCGLSRALRAREAQNLPAGVVTFQIAEVA